MIALLAALAAGATPITPAQAAAKRVICKAPKYPGSGYFTSLTVTGTSCTQGKRVAIAYYKCRTRTRVNGRCSGGVLGYTCTDKRTVIPTEIDGRVTCRKGSATIVHTYQQDT